MEIRSSKNGPCDSELLVKYIETLTHSGLPSLDNDLVAKIKKICKKDGNHLENACNTILKQLKKNHSEVRLSAFQLCTELFKKAHNFRLLVIKNLEEIIDLTAGLEPEKPLPPPKEPANALKKLLVLTVQQWNTEYGQSYRQLRVCYDYLSRCRQVNFYAVQQEAEAEAAASLEREQQVLRARQQIFDDFRSDFNAQAPEIENTIETILNCVSLLLPPPEDFFVADAGGNNVSDGDDGLTFSSNSTNVADKDESFNLRQFGLSSSYNLVINIDHHRKVHINRTEENSAIIDNLKENIQIAKKRFRAVIKKWEDSLSRCSLGEEFICKVQSFKNKLEGCLKKHTELKIESIEGECTDDDDDDSEMEEVVKEGYEPAVLPIFQDPGPSTSKSSEEVLKKCPYDRKIVACDERGRSSREKDEPSSSLPSGNRELDDSEEEPVPDWQDPILLAQLKAATGIDLKMPDKKKKGRKLKKKVGRKIGGRRKKGQPSSEVLEDIKKRNFPGLTDIERRKNNAKARLKKKLLKRSALRRVADALNKFERCRYENHLRQ